MALQLDAARNLLRAAPDEADMLLSRLVTQVHEAVADIRRLVHALRPPALDELGLVGAVRELARQLDGEGIHVEVEARAAPAGLPAAVEVAAYRVVQEGLTNVVRHAGARRCRVAFEGGRELRVVIEDDGRGMGPAARHGVGLTSMRERAVELGGSLRIEERASGGTRIEAVMPLSGGTQ